MTDSSRRRVAAALLLCDIVDSTAMVTSLGDRRAAEILERFDRVARDLLPLHEGREIDRTDGFLMLFERAVDAVRYAEALHVGLAGLSESEGLPVAVRVGIHFGEVLLRDNPPVDVARGAKPLEVEGLAKPIAARVMSKAVGGQTLVTDPAASLARRALIGERSVVDWSWTRHGAYALKGVDEPLGIWEAGDRSRTPHKRPSSPVEARRWNPRVLAAFGIGLVLFALLATSGLPTHRERGFTDPPIAFEDVETQRLFEQAFEKWADADARAGMKIWREIDRIDDGSPTHWLLGQLLLHDGGDTDLDLLHGELPRRARGSTHPHAQPILAVHAMHDRGTEDPRRFEVLKAELPHDPDDLLLEASRAGTNFYKWNDVDVAQSIVARAPDLPRAHLELAHAYRHADPMDPRVVEQFEEVIRLVPTSPSVHIQYARHLLWTDQLDALRELLPRALEVAPISEVRVSAGEVSLLAGDLDAFRRHLVVLESGGDAVLPECARMAENLLLAGRPHEALEALARTHDRARSARDHTWQLATADLGRRIGSEAGDVDVVQHYVEQIEQTMIRPGLPDGIRKIGTSMRLEGLARLAVMRRDGDALGAVVRELEALEADGWDMAAMLGTQRGFVEALGGDLQRAGGLWAEQPGRCTRDAEIADRFVLLGEVAAATPYAQAVLADASCSAGSGMRHRWRRARSLAVVAQVEQQAGNLAEAEAAAAEALALMPVAESDVAWLAGAREIAMKAHGAADGVERPPQP